jgi:hypothetical protein
MPAKRLLPLLFVLLAVPAIAQTPDSARPVNVMIDSRPDFAEVRIDGVFVGSAPLQYRLAPGVHKITMVRPRYASWTRELTVNAGMSTRVVALLEETGREQCPPNDSRQ